MKIVDFNAKYAAEITVALGFFDCVHLGHAAVIGEAKKRALNAGCECAVMTFTDDISRADKPIYAFDERCAALENLGVDVVIAAKFNAAFAATPPIEFVNALTHNFKIVAAYAGEDYTFGKGAEGNTALLKAELEKGNIEAHILPFVSANDGKISASRLKKYVASGDIEALNAYLSEPYFMLGKVISARHVGTSLGFPTANLCVSPVRSPLADGIYATKIDVDGKTHCAMTNIGGKPTFGDDVKTIETHIFDFSEDIYGKEVKLSFYRRTRDVRKFASPMALKEQLLKDERQIRGYFETNGGES